MVVFEGGYITIPNPGFLTCPGKEFDSWNTEENGNGDKHEKGDWVRVVNNMTLYAQWK